MNISANRDFGDAPNVNTEQYCVMTGPPRFPIQTFFAHGAAVCKFVIITSSLLAILKQASIKHNGPEPDLVQLARTHIR